MKPTTNDTEQALTAEYETGADDLCYTPGDFGVGGDEDGVSYASYRWTRAG